jgi:hypothetical protein
MDNVPVHSIIAVRALNVAGAILLYLLAYSPDLYSIEMMFANLKARESRRASLQEVLPRSNRMMTKFIELTHNHDPRRCGETGGLFNNHNSRVKKRAAETVRSLPIWKLTMIVRSPRVAM